MSKASCSESETPELNKGRVKKEFFEKGKMYIWVPDNERRAIVHLNDDGDGLVEIDRHGEEDHWYFEHNLIGWVYGPFVLSKRKLT